MRKLLFLCCGLILSGCDLNHVDLYTPPSKSELAGIARRKAAANLKAKENLCPFGTAGQMMDQIKMLGLSFHYYDPVDIEKGRELLVTAVNELTTVVNEDVRIRPYLSNYPFEAKNIEIEIFVYNPDRTRVPPGELVVLTARGGELTYKIDNPKGKFEFKIDVLKETYEEALAKQEESIASKNQTEKIAI